MSRPARKPLRYAVLAATLLLPSLALRAQTPVPPLAIPPKGPTLTPLTLPTLSAGQLELVRLEGEFSDAVAQGGGKAFAAWFADDGITLQNAQPPVLGRAAIAAAAQWLPQNYQLTWYAEGAQMGPNALSGFAWGHYTALTITNGKPVAASGRFITVWKKVAGQWKVALDASANDVPANALDPLPKP